MSHTSAFCDQLPGQTQLKWHWSEFKELPAHVLLDTTTISNQSAAQMNDVNASTTTRRAWCNDFYTLRRFRPRAVTPSPHSISWLLHPRNKGSSLPCHLRTAAASATCILPGLNSLLPLVLLLLLLLLQCCQAAAHQQVACKLVPATVLHHQPPS
jgi:hypothetical protein